MLSAIAVGDAKLHELGLCYSVREPVQVKSGHQTGHQVEYPECQILRLAMVSILVSIFRPNRVDLVDFRDFGDSFGFR